METCALPVDTVHGVCRPLFMMYVVQGYVTFNAVAYDSSTKPGTLLHNLEGHPPKIVTFQKCSYSNHKQAASWEMNCL